MVKHTRTVRRQFADELFECVWPFCEIDVKKNRKFIHGWIHYSQQGFTLEQSHEQVNAGWDIFL